MSLEIADTPKKVTSISSFQGVSFHQTPQSFFNALLAEKPPTLVDGIAKGKADCSLTIAKTSVDAPLNHPILDTDQGQIEIDIDAYFDPQSAPTYKAIPGATLPPLLSPTSVNMKALLNHASAKLQGALEANNIPDAPSQIAFDNQGQLLLPADYPYADQLKGMFQKELGLERELRTLNALSSHLVGSEDSVAFSNEYQMANSKAAVDAVLAKFSFLFNSNRPSAQIALNFRPDGQLQITADGTPVKF